ncbi:refractory to sigma P isoform X2 [Lasioglossum baleicum]|uniref:refractory to sigma P isoform X2 n=1 Tax=Lasioglossum baleicum TaxID=434251 RepID=UPI003FCCBC16
MSKLNHCKVVLQNDDGSAIETRRFDILAHDLNFESMCGKLKSIFPELRDKNFTVSFIDEEGDKIRMTSTEDLSIALEISEKMKRVDTPINEHYLLNRPIIRLHVKLNQKDKNTRFFQKEAIIHDNVICDGCNNNISGFRYKCMTCVDFDLCSQCEKLGLHAEHFMLRTLQPLDWSTRSRRYFHHYSDYIRKFLRTKNTNYCNREASCHESNKEKQPKGNAATNENIIEESLKKNITLVDLTVNEPLAFSDNTFVSHNDTVSAVSPLMEEWTMLDKTDISPASSVSSNLNESSENNLATAPVTTTATAPVTTTATVPVTIPKPTTATTSATAPVITPVTISAATSVITSATTSATATATTSETASAAARKAALHHLSALNHSRIYPALPKESRIHHPNPRIHNALVTMISMGFSNNGGVLTHLLETENGDINKVLDILEYGKT